MGGPGPLATLGATAWHPHPHPHPRSAEVSPVSTAPNPGSRTSRDAYAGAVDHYTSPTRRDWVKRAWEEPELVRVLDAAVRASARSVSLDVLDVGCGAGVALELLRATPALTVPDAPSVRYLGIDLDPDLLRVAEARFGDTATRFLQADVTDGVPGLPHDLYLSTGVPYSHLTRDELREVVSGVLRAARRHPRPTVLVIDVLGRYSIEWTLRWAQTRWDYRMSFFATDQELSSTAMSTYGGSELDALLREAAEVAGCELDRIELVDRSLVVGRHTATGEYTPGLRNYRQLVNDLADPDTLVEMAELRLADVELPEAPEPVARFFAGFVARWDARITAAQVEARGRNDREVAADLQPALATDLKALELTSQPGLGVGHSLTATVVTTPGA